MEKHLEPSRIFGSVLPGLIWALVFCEYGYFFNLSLAHTTYNEIVKTVSSSAGLVLILFACFTISWVSGSLSSVILNRMDGQKLTDLDTIQKIDITVDGKIKKFYEAFLQENDSLNRGNFFGFCKQGLYHYSIELSRLVEKIELDVGFTGSLIFPLFALFFLNFCCVLFADVNAPLRVIFLIIAIFAASKMCLSFRDFYHYRQRERELIFRTFYMAAPKDESGKYDPLGK